MLKPVFGPDPSVRGAMPQDKPARGSQNEADGSGERVRADGTGEIYGEEKGRSQEVTREMNDSVDGFVVDRYGATFSGTVDIELPDARYMKYDDELLIVARVRVKMPRLREARNGDITRTNVLGVQDLALVRSDKLRAHLCDTLGLERLSDTQLQLPELAQEPDSVEPKFEEIATTPPSATPTASELYAGQFDEWAAEIKEIPEKLTPSPVSIDEEEDAEDRERLTFPTKVKDRVLAGFLYGD
jgi:hypothetical protein